MENSIATEKFQFFPSLQLFLAGMDDNFVEGNVRFYNRAFNYYANRDPSKSLKVAGDRIALYGLMVKNFVPADFQHYAASTKLEGFKKRLNPKAERKIPTISDTERERLLESGKQHMYDLCAIMTKVNKTVGRNLSGPLHH